MFWVSGFSSSTSISTLNCSNSIGVEPVNQQLFWQHEEWFCSKKSWFWIPPHSFHYPIMTLITMWLIFWTVLGLDDFSPRFEVWFSINEIFKSTSCSIEFT
jgi:hypothetical protein